MAHPDEPSRPLIKSPTASPSDSSHALLPPLRLAVGLFLLALASCMLVYAAFATPGQWFPTAETKRWSPSAMTVSRGRSEMRPNGLVVVPSDSSGTVIVAVATTFRSSDYPVVSWAADNMPDAAQVRLMWRNDYEPARLNMVPITVASGQLLPVSLRDQGAWSGTITGLALAIQSPVVQPVLVQGVAAQPMGIVELLHTRFAEWLTWQNWTQSSINTVTGGAEVQEVPLSILLMATVALASLLGGALAWRQNDMRSLPFIIGALFFAAWLVMDARWTWSLSRRVAVTVTQYGGKNDEARHVAADDGRLYQFMQHVRSKLPEQPVRVFVATGSLYDTGRGAYHLYPHNVFFDPFQNQMLGPQWMRGGDYLVAYQRRGVQFDAVNGRLRWDNHDSVPAELVLADSGGALFRLL